MNVSPLLAASLACMAICAVQLTGCAAPGVGADVVASFLDKVALAGFYGGIGFRF